MENDISQNVYFWLSLTGLVFGILHYGIKQCCKSNCSKVKCCGMTVIERETDPNTGIIRNESDSI